jgi:hypothetical protein
LIHIKGSIEIRILIRIGGNFTLSQGPKRISGVGDGDSSNEPSAAGANLASLKNTLSNEEISVAVRNANASSAFVDLKLRYGFMVQGDTKDN